MWLVYLTLFFFSFHFNIFVIALFVNVDCDLNCALCVFVAFLLCQWNRLDFSRKIAFTACTYLYYEWVVTTAPINPTATIYSPCVRSLLAGDCKQFEWIKCDFDKKSTKRKITKETSEHGTENRDRSTENREIEKCRARCGERTAEKSSKDRVGSSYGYKIIERINHRICRPFVLCCVRPVITVIIY